MDKAKKAVEGLGEKGVAEVRKLINPAYTVPPSSGMGPQFSVKTGTSLLLTSIPVQSKHAENEIVLRESTS